MAESHGELVTEGRVETDEREMRARGRCGAEISRWSYGVCSKGMAALQLGVAEEREYAGQI